ncbi:MAG TPA: amidohydrolase family protein [Actinomycetes bacterium]
MTDTGTSADALPVTLLLGGRIRAPDSRQPSGAPATAMVVRGAAIEFVGSDSGASDFLERMGRAPDETVRLDGALVTPAFVDAHVHTSSTGLALTGLDLTEITSLTELLAAVEAYARRNRGGAVVGHGWDETRWPEGRPPTREELDRASYGGVVYLSRVDVHSAVVSSALLAVAPEIRAQPGYADSGHVSRDAHHVARGVVREARTTGQRQAAQRSALRRAAELGIGAIHELAGPDISSEDDLRSLLEMVAAEPNHPEVIPYWGELGGVERARELGALGAAGDLFADGAIGSHTACLRTAYADLDTSGFAYLTASQVRDHAAACTRAGIQAGFHAIGDGAMEAVVRGFQEAADIVGTQAMRQVRHRIEHAEMIEPWMVATMARLGVYASVQPAFDRLWGGATGMYAQRLGPARALRLNPYAAMQAGGVVLALGSDSPVTPLDPWGTVRAAVFHHVPEQRMSLTDAFAAHTVGGWRVARRDAEGALERGAPATYAVWDTASADGTDLPDLSPEADLPRCLRTVTRGQTIFGSPS